MLAESELLKGIMKKQENNIAFLLSVSGDMAKVRGRTDLLNVINSRLKILFTCTHCGIGIVNTVTGETSPFLIDPDSKASYDTGYAGLFDDFDIRADNIINQVTAADVPLVFNLEAEEKTGRLPAIFKKNLQLGIKEVLMVAFNINAHLTGVLSLFSDVAYSFPDQYFDILKGISNQLSIATANIIANEQILESEKEKTFLLSVSHDFVACRNKNEFLDVVHEKMGALFPYREMVISLLNEDGNTHSAYLYNLTEESRNHQDYQERAAEKYMLEDGIYDILLNSEVPLVYDLEALLLRDFVPPYINFFYENGSRELVTVPLRENDRCIGGVFIWMGQKNTFTPSQLNLLTAFCSQISIAVANIRAYEKIESQLKQIDQFKAQLEEEKLYLQQQIDTAYNHGEIIGQNGGLKDVFNLISRVAVTDSTVMILGESGTGKELIARAIHNASPRKDKMLVKVNCAALPASLIESELFGHEKGSFTGANERRIGKFELAHNGTIFLDEIGELPPDLQVKLLRVIQEKEIERVGGHQTIKTDVRIITATNRNLLTEVDSGGFRIDLFYRLNVFPINLPPLRERAEDIPLLITHYINKFAQKFGKRIDKIADSVLKQMTAYSWPGNVRELEHLIERSVLMASGNTLKEVFLPKAITVSPPVDKVPATEVTLLDECERQHIIHVLKHTAGRVKGPGGAAEILGLPSTTLHSRMKKLKIEKADI